MELLDKGKHCDEEFCHQLDFLPMQCKACKKHYCSEHFKFEAHGCTESKKLDYKIPTCELCNQTIEFKRGLDLDFCLAQHMQRCEFNENSNLNRKKLADKKCNFKSCKSKEIFRFDCENCSKMYCVKHRIPEDHLCTFISHKSESCSKQARNGENLGIANFIKKVLF